MVKNIWDNSRMPLALEYIALEYINIESELLSRVRLFATPWTIESMEFSRPKYQSG